MIKMFKGFTSSLFSAYTIRQQFPLLHPNKPRIKYSKAQKKKTFKYLLCAENPHTSMLSYKAVSKEVFT